MSQPIATFAKEFIIRDNPRQIEKTFRSALTPVLTGLNPVNGAKAEIRIYVNDDLQVVEEAGPDDQLFLSVDLIVEVEERENGKAVSMATKVHKEAHFKDEAFHGQYITHAEGEKAAKYWANQYLESLLSTIIGLEYRAQDEE